MDLRSARQLIGPGRSSVINRQLIGPGSSSVINRQLIGQEDLFVINRQLIDPRRSLSLSVETSQLST
ncbi:hypothetical protein CEXT_315761 [Caerostris extrusa]|uniref:Uncharacterized protein n=1 Tax=Caerostris extrusa TaxID=172846 RepID=A0AAV4VZG4_CAEEX|nr:hypothetical protein CEXT_315761 [Caerostris extrusa]